MLVDVGWKLFQTNFLSTVFYVRLRNSDVGIGLVDFFIKHLPFWTFRIFFYYLIFAGGIKVRNSAQNKLKVNHTHAKHLFEPWTVFDCELSNGIIKKQLSFHRFNHCLTTRFFVIISPFKTFVIFHTVLCQSFWTFQLINFQTYLMECRITVCKWKIRFIQHSNFHLTSRKRCLIKCWIGLLRPWLLIF